MKKELIIFDCDGVLVDSEALSSKIFCELLNEIGLAISYKQTVKDFEGRSDSDCLKIIEARLGRKVPDSFMKDYYKRLVQCFHTHLRPIPNIIKALKTISMPSCVASSGPYEKMQLTLGITRLLPLFEGRIFSATEVKRGKPYPDLFLFAARKMNVSPEACIVVEDSVYGVQAGIAAGMTVLGYARRSDAALLASAGALVFKNMKDLPALLKKSDA